jgi:N-acetylmuramoyl-L-alanine amidase
MGLKVLSVIVGLGVAASASAFIVFSPASQLLGKERQASSVSHTKAVTPGGLVNGNGTSDPHQPLVVIDPGHGAEDPGARSVFGVAEKDITWKFSSQIAQDLKDLGVRVVLTRSKDGNPSLSDRLSYGLSNHTAFFLSVHANSFDGSPDVRGAEIHVYDPQRFTETKRYPGTKLSAEAAQGSLAISESIVHEMKTHPVGIPVRAGEPDGICYDVDFVCRLNDGPAGLIELGFLSNPTDAKMLTNPKVQATYAEDIATGIADKVLSGSSLKH